jgi:hypothetical protein
MNKEDLIRLWEEHIAHEFQTYDTEATHDTEATLDTIVPDSYVNHIPVCWQQPVEGVSSIWL